MNDDSAVTMREWHSSGRMVQRELTMVEYNADMHTNRLWEETVHHWSGEARDGSPLHVTWLPAPQMGTVTFYVYEVQPKTPPKPAVRYTSLEGCSRFTIEMDERAAFANIGSVSAQGHSVDMRMVKDRQGESLLVTYTRSGDARAVYEFSGA